MSTLSSTQQYEELIQAFQNYLTQEYPKGTWIPTDLQNYNYFLQLASAHPTGGSTKNPNPPPTINVPLARSASMPPRPSSQPAPIAMPSTHPKNETSEEFIKKDETTIEAKPAPKSPLTQKQIAIETLPPSTAPDFTEMKALFKEKLPHVLLSETLADDSEAKAFALRWKAPSTEIVILSFSDHPPEKAFLTHLCTALHQCFRSAKLISAAKIEEEKGWDQLLKAENLRIVIASHNSIHALPELMKFYHEEAAGRHRLGRIQLFLLSDLSLYMQQPSLKASLWRTLGQTLTSFIG